MEYVIEEQIRTADKQIKVSITGSLYGVLIMKTRVVVKVRDLPDAKIQIAAANDAAIGECRVTVSGLRLPEDRQ